MTKTATLDRARAHLRFGYYQPDSMTECYVFCPECRQKVGTSVMAWDKVHARTRALVEALAEHLREEH